MAGDDDDAFSFGDFTFALPPHSQAHINGVTSTSINNNDNLWGDFLITPHLSSSSKSSSSSSQFQFNNGFSSNPTNSAQPTPSIRADPVPNKVQKPKGALPLSLFGEVEDEDEEEDESDKNNSKDGLNKWVDPNSQNGKFGVNNNNGVVPKSDKENGFVLNLNGVASDLIVDDHKMNNDDDDDDDWEFKGAFSDNNNNNNNGGLKEGIFKDESVVSGSKFEPFPAAAKQELQAGQDAFSFADTKPGSTSFVPQSIDLFAISNGNGPSHQSSGLDVGFNSTTSTTNGFLWDPFSGVESIGNGSETNASVINQDDDEFDDFGDFVDASQEVASKEQQGQVVIQMNPTEAQIPNGEVQDKQTQTEHSRGALPLSFFSDVAEEPSDDLDLQNEVVHKATLSSGNSFSGHGSAISINDLISNLYSQAQLTSPVITTEKPPGNGVHSPQKATGINLLGGDDNWDDGSRESKGTVLENGVSEQLSTAISEKTAQKQSRILPEQHDYMEFYDSLKDSLCFLLTCQLDELKNAENSDGESEATDDEIQEAFKLLEESVNSKEELAKKNLQRDSCLNKLLEVLQGPKFNVIESDFQLSKRLHLAEKEWRIAAELLRHAMSILKILPAGSTDERPHYASTWSKIIDICVQELRHGASIWKRASEKNVQHQIFSNSRGQQNILALGEVYKVVKLLELSAKLYRPIVLPSVSDSSQLFGVLNECDDLWSSIGLEELFQSSSDNESGCSESAGALIASIKNIHSIDVFALHNFIFTQHKPICQLSLLPQDMLDDLKMVTWGEKAYFLNLANLWANLISCEPPQLPQLQVC